MVRVAPRRHRLGAARGLRDLRGLLSLAITFFLVTDGFMVVVLFRLRAGTTRGAVPGSALPGAPLLFLGIYVLLLVGALIQQATITLTGWRRWAGGFRELVGRRGG